MFPMGTGPAWRVEVPSPTSLPEVDTTGWAAPLLELACCPCVMLVSAPALATAAAVASASPLSLEDSLEAFNALCRPCTQEFRHTS